MFIALPSYTVTFTLGDTLVEWQVNREEGLEEFCKVLRLNRITAYAIKQIPMFGEQGS